jgi:putative hydrolase of the HAD superfamily
MRPGLILDAGGVLVSEPVPRWLLWAADGDDQRHMELQQAYDRLYQPLWSGHISARQAFSTLARFCDRSAEQLERELVGGFELLDVSERLHDWAEVADVAVLSNHRSSWLRPLLDQIRAPLAAVWISEEMGVAKPAAPAFVRPRAWSRSRPAALFVDDHVRNVHAAEEASIPSLLADSPAWPDAVDAWLAEAALLTA